MARSSKNPQDELAFIEADVPTLRREHAVPVIPTSHRLPTLAQFYRDRADCENNFDELKNQWDCGGFTIQDPGRCQLIARFVFVRLANRGKHHRGLPLRDPQAGLCLIPACHDWPARRVGARKLGLTGAVDCRI
ncbi:MAG: hypothetical protein M0Z84_11960 [Gammaproteobacteria bacterium]|nr:hypothetical protein [Gammaproteobacteria bacterium]